MDAQCPRCLSLERHRHLALVLSDGIINKGSDILHFAQKNVLVTSFVHLRSGYVTADLLDIETDLRHNIEEIALTTNPST